MVIYQKEIDLGHKPEQSEYEFAVNMLADDARRYLYENGLNPMDYMPTITHKRGNKNYLTHNKEIIEITLTEKGDSE